jgi:hypothetical protein
MKDRVKQVVLEADMLVNLLAQLARRDVVVTIDGMPEGAEVVDVRADNFEVGTNRRTFRLVVRHSTFDEVQESGILPLLVLRVTRFAVGPEPVDSWATRAVRLREEHGASHGQ